MYAAYCVDHYTIIGNGIGTCSVVECKVDIPINYYITLLGSICWEEGEAPCLLPAFLPPKPFLLQCTCVQYYTRAYIKMQPASLECI